MRAWIVRMLLVPLAFAGLGAVVMVRVAVNGSTDCVDYCPCVHVSPDSACVPGVLEG